VTDLPGRPQARLDLWAGKGMAVTVGRLRPDPVLGLRCVVLGHNLIRGAAGAAIANAELLVRCHPERSEGIDLTRRSAPSVASLPQGDNPVTVAAVGRSPLSQ